MTRIASITRITHITRPAALATLLPAALALFGAFGSAPASASVSFTVSFDDATAAYSAYYADLQRTVIAVGNDWMSHFATPLNTTLSVQIGFGSINTANGGSATAVQVGTTAGGLALYEQGAANKIKTGADANGSAADIKFTVGINGYLQNELWFDPNPVAQTAVVPSTKTDARSVFLHEFGHALGFNGYRDYTTLALPGTYESTYDLYASLANTANGPTPFFTGPNAMALYGGAVPLTYGNYAHVGNFAPRDGVGLVSDLMNGVVYYRGTRYEISDLDLAIMKDVGLPVLAAVPEPASYAMLLAGLAALGGLRLGKQRQPQG